LPKKNNKKTNTYIVTYFVKGYVVEFYSEKYSKLSFLKSEKVFFEIFVILTGRFSSWFQITKMYMLIINVKEGSNSFSLPPINEKN
jgi:hypothetical protein